MKKIFTIALLFYCTYASAQTTVKGILTDENKKPSGNVTVILKAGADQKTVTSDESGAFSFDNVAKGSYRLSFTGSGFDAYEQRIKVGENKELDLGDIILLHTSMQLQSVEITGVRGVKYNSDYSFSGTKTATLNKDIPQGISSVTKELIADRQAFQVADAVKIVSGVIPSSYYNQYSIRGFSQNEEGQIINGMRTRQYFFIQPLTCNIERVEVVKGNSSATFASADPGGSINMVTKKPIPDARKEVNIGFGSFSTMRSTADFTGPLNKDKTLLYRLNAGYQEGKSFRSLVNQKNVLVSPSISYIPNEKTAVNVEFNYNTMNGKLDRGQPIFGAVAGTTNLNSTPISLNLCAPNDYYKSAIAMVMGNISHHFTDNISFNVSYMKQTWTEDLLEHRTTNQFAVDTANKAVSTYAGMRAVERQQFWDIDNLNAYLNFDLKTGPIKHKLLAGFDLSRWDQTTGAQNNAGGYLLKDGTVSSTYNKANIANYQTIVIGGKVMPKPNVPYFDLANPTNYIRNISDYVFSQTLIAPILTVTNAAYIQEQLSWKKFMLLAALRHEWYKNITNHKLYYAKTVEQTVILPRVGLTYSLNKNVNLYGTYLEGFQPQSNTATILSVIAPAGSNFAPLRSDLKEIGAKTKFLNGHFTANVAFYEINQTNILVSANSVVNPDSVVLRGAAKSNGAELDVAGFILPNWQLAASYSYIDAKIIKDSDPKLENQRKENTPVHSANLWTRYNFSTIPFLKNLGVGLGVQYNDNRVPWLTRSFLSPAYTLLDGAIYYTPSKSNMQLALNVYNLANTTYWTGAFNYLRLFPGAPRNVMFTATYKF